MTGKQGIRNEDKNFPEQSKNIPKSIQNCNGRYIQPWEKMILVLELKTSRKTVIFAEKSDTFAHVLICNFNATTITIFRSIFLLCPSVIQFMAAM